LAGRRINDGRGVFVAQRLVKLMVQAGLQIKGARVGVLGITFKENVSDLRNSRVPDIIRELVQFGVECLPNDPLADREEAHEEYGFHTLPLTELSGLDAVIVAVSHEQYRALGAAGIRSLLRPGGVVVDIKGVFRPADFEPGYHYWSL
jgi:UDP-N-acetyl-D-galactosamine dehydrogenase